MYFIPQERYIAEKPIKIDEKWPADGAIIFEKAELRYRENTALVFNQLSFSVAPAEKIGIVGRTGAGKSTISVALSRLVELSGGRILIDGVDIAAIDLTKLREKVTFIPQDPSLFTGSLRFNIDPFGSCSDSEIERLAARAGLADILLRKQTAEMIVRQGGCGKNFGKKGKKKKKAKKGRPDAMTELTSDAIESINKGGVYFWLTENGNNLSVGER